MTSDTIGRSNCFVNSRCHARSSPHGPMFHSTMPESMPKRRHELQILILNVLRLVRGDAAIREQPVEIARALSDRSRA